MVRRTADPEASTERETLICWALLRQMEAPCQVLQGAYGRLVEAASGAGGLSMRTVILDWLEAELASARALDTETGRRCTQLMRAAVALAHALKQ